MSDLLLDSLLKFYKNAENASLFKQLISTSQGISLRLIDWFVTEYSKDNSVIYKKKNGKQFLVHVGYKSGLKGFQKKFFDPFCRSKRITVDICEEPVVTTIAQLNFIKWCIQNQVIDYINDNRGQLQTKMRTKKIK